MCKSFGPVKANALISMGYTIFKKYNNIHCICIDK
uniref:Uncharacterized protein n=1 Tax=Anguilla anguilla TaxID=7936 RepID=A0A0E9VNR4_ANGAN